MPVTLICQYQPCSKPFSVIAARRDKAKFCSNACRFAAMVLAPEDRKTCTLICRSCGGPFVVDYYKKDTAHYCSTSCHAEAKKKPVDPIVCAYEPCSKSFTVIAARKDAARFCSKPCHDNWRADQHHDAFWDKVARCSHGIDCPYCCWPWKGETANKYRTTHVHNKPIGAHRRAWEHGNNRVMPPELDAAHWCHWRPCCNPLHLRPATPKENTADSVRDQRMRFGENHTNSKMNEETAQEAFRLKVSGWTNKRIADHLHVSKSTITNLMAGLIWRHLPRPPVLPKQKPPGRPKRNLL